jgi:hypothetical protein
MEACKTITGNPNDTQWHTLPVTIGDIANNSAPVYAYINYPDTPAVWPHVANLGFVEKIPPDCNIPYDDCNNNLYLPEITLNQVPNGYSGYDICADTKKPLEGIKVFWTDSLYSFNLDVCYNSERQKLWFNIANNHTLLINYSYAICEGNLPPGQNCQFINDWTEMMNTLTCIQYEAILHATYFYGNRATPCYFFKNIIYEHEMEHVKDYQMAIDSAKRDFFSNLDSINVSCENFENPDSARNFLQQALERRFNQFRRRGLEEFIEIQNQGAIRSGIGSYEQDVQNRHSVRAIINGQIDAVNVAYGCSIIHLYE